MSADQNVTDTGPGEVFTQHNSPFSSEEHAGANATGQRELTRQTLEHRNGIEHTSAQQNLDEDASDIGSDAAPGKADNFNFSAAKKSPSLEGSTPDDSLSFQVSPPPVI